MESKKPDMVYRINLYSNIYSGMYDLHFFQKQYSRAGVAHIQEHIPLGRHNLSGEQFHKTGLFRNGADPDHTFGFPG